MVLDFWQIFADFVDSNSCAAAVADFAGNKAAADADMSPNYVLKN